MNERQARYILLMLGTFPDEIYWHGATGADVDQRERIVERYFELRPDGFSTAMLTAKIEFILRIANEGVPEGAGID